MLCWNAFEQYSVDEIGAGGADTFTTVTQIATGFYEVTYTPTDVDLNGDGSYDNIGSWSDLWVATIDGVPKFSRYVSLTLEPGPFGATIIKSTFSGASIHFQ